MRWNASLYRGSHRFVAENGADVLEWLDAQMDERVLDVGCGTGELTARIAATGAQVVGVDASPQMIKAARDAFASVRFEIADMRCLAYRGEFDALFSNAALHWVPAGDQPKALAGLFAALKPGGRFAAEMGGQGNVEPLDSALSHALGAQGLREQNYYPSAGQYGMLLEQAGFRVRQMALIDRPTPLSGGQDGLRNWFDMFRADSLGTLSQQAARRAVCEAEDSLRARYFDGERWIAPYVRLRFLAERPVLS